MKHPAEPMILPLSHDEARYALQAAADGQLTAADQQALDQHLAACAECQAYAAGLGGLEARLSASLQQRWPMAAPDAQPVSATLEAIHRNERTTRMKTFLSGSIRTLGWATLAILLMAALGWGIQALRAAPLPASNGDLPTPTTEASGELPTATAPAIGGTPAAGGTPSNGGTPTLAPTPLPSLLMPVPGVFPQVEFIFTAPFPESPQTVTLYRHQLGETITAENARQAAAQLGVQGGVYEMPSEGFGQNVYEVTDGFRLLRFLSFPGQFVYEGDATHFYNPGEPLPYEEQVRIATEFLNRYNLLDLPYRAEPAPVQPNTVVFTPLLDDRPVIYGIGENPGNLAWISVSLDAAGQVSSALVSRQTFEPAGEFPILTAEQAWARLGEQDALQHAQYAVLAADEPDTYRQWARTYPAGEPVDLYGYVQVRQAVEPGDPTLVSLASYLVTNDETLAANDPWTLIHGWGQFNPGENGNLLFNLDGWEISTLESEYLTGTVQRQDNEALFVTADDRTFILPNLPAEVPTGVPADIAGMVLPGDPPVLEWGYISTGVYPSSYYMSYSCGGGGGGGGGGPDNANFGGGNLALPGIDPDQQPTPTAAPGPYAAGERLEAVSGQILVTNHRYIDGSTSLEINFQSDPSEDPPYGNYFRLEGEALAGIEQYHNLPVRIWGSVTGVDNYTPVVSVERYEPLDPGLQLQEWAGTEQIISLEGQEVVLLTTGDGQSFVLQSSLTWGAEGNLIGVPGDLVGIEGYIIPDQQFGGYPVIRDVAGEMPPDGVVASSEPYEYDHAQDLGAFPAEVLSGQVTIDRIELAYASITLTHCTADQAADPSLAPWLVVQPTWVFSGHFDDGRLFTIQVNALPDEYLP